MTGNTEHGRHARRTPSPCTSLTVRNGKEATEGAVDTLDDALNRLRAYCDVLDWLLVHPPEEPELVCMTVDEIRRTLGTALSARDTLLRARLARR